MKDGIAQQGATGGQLLTRYRHIRTSDTDELCETVGKVLDARHQQWCPGERDVPTDFNATSVGSMIFTYTAHGATLRCSADPRETFYAVLIPVAGRAKLRCGSTEVHADTQGAALVNPDVDFDMYVEAGTEQLSLRLECDEMERQLERMLGRQPARRLRFEPAGALTTPAARSWLSTVLMVCRDLDGPEGLRHALLQRQIEHLVMGQALTAMKHSCSAELEESVWGRPSTPALMRRADQIISDHAHEALTVHDVAEAVGVSVRSLQEGFRRHYNTTPSARLRRARLDGVRADLLAADPAHNTVSKLALSWGFVHFGRFAGLYRAVFDESPSVTLNR